jgi:L-alanine-DL-glutamate epimerase-like enolase superfamily enzyme
MCPHWFQDLHVHLVAASPNGQYVEYFPDGKVFNFCEIIDRQLELRDGGLVLPTEPGLGYRFDEKRLHNFTQKSGVERTILELLLLFLSI